MTPTLFGIPFYLWGVVCLGVAAIYTAIWPKPKPGAPARPAWRQFILRWFHTLVWVLLAGACWARATGWANAPFWSNRLGLTGLAVYLIFLTTFVMDRHLSR
ncbi:MAG: hypothetical protein HW378_4168 [Anaerolineales bacterium]|nr:hypothetical protein [Anaerolineales bacterium]